MCLFNENSEVTCEQIKQKTSVGHDYFEAAMKRLCNPKGPPVLQKERPKRPIFDENEKIRVDLKFNSPNIRNNYIPQRCFKKKSIQPTAEEVKETRAINNERQYVIQAQAVKVMKTKKQYKVIHLTSDIITNISMFKAGPKMIKEQIDYLIEREYMKRQEGDRTTLIYVP